MPLLPEVQSGGNVRQGYDFQPHIWPVGSDFVNMRLECRRCGLKKSAANAFSPVHFSSRFVRRRGGIHAIRLHPFCRMCRKELRSRWVNHPLFSQKLHSYFNKLFNSLKGGAATRNLLVTVDLDDLIELWLYQGGQCAVSGYPMSIDKKSPHFKDPMCASVDRIDSDQGYHRANIQLVCVRVNLMKSDLHQTDLLEWCRRIVAHQIKKEDELLKLIEAA